MKTAIITDSNSGITRELGEQWGVRIVPMPIIIENETYYEGVDLFPEEFFRMLREGKSVSTSQPAPEDILRLWEEALSSGYDEVVYIPMTSGLSSSCQTALILAADFGGRVQVADNRQISVPLKNAVRDALALAEADVGIAMGSMGSDVAIQSADIALMNNDLTNIPFVIALARHTKLVMYQNIGIAFSVSLVMMVLAAVGIIPALAGAFLHNIGAFIILINSSRILRSREKEEI